MRAWRDEAVATQQMARSWPSRLRECDGGDAADATAVAPKLACALLGTVSRAWLVGSPSVDAASARQWLPKGHGPTDPTVFFRDLHRRW